MKHLKISSKLLVVLAVSLSLFLSACTASEKENKRDQIRIAEVTRSIFYAPQYVAIEKGYFKQAGIDIDLKTTWGGDKTMTALLSNGADIALVGSETSIYVNSQGTNDPILNFAQLTETDGTFLVSRKSLKNFSWSQLKGKTFLGQRKGGMPQMAGEYSLKKHGIDPHKDVTLLQNIDFANIANAFASGTGDFVQLFEPQASMFEQKGIGHVVASFGKESGKLPYTSYMAKESFLKSHGDVLQRYTKALYKAQQFVESHSAEETAKLIAPYFEDTSVTLIEKVVQRYKEQHSYAKTPLLQEEAWNNLQRIMKSAKELDHPAPYKQYVNTTFAQNAIK
ncbi:nitrate/sulfonate/taurine/bicarbonate ABC transporter periplasmic protein [Fictibacillus macauensis ZFHKF-1]|uniref:Nitrate/sulfonate/taurine/bicarbonate ABC transporter periplasmic protein n=1 Tax=Fictibacillus macauensis ZFHKF-1 TaxID=1196324 RepID=I8UF79_9BACL|nr:ABC transporter substrate-binding protein [Fictibacillus macauensis]EIT85540.1 nitrate/sulfonate/taurine/bicarbonate ABC transporter periplasmic protein [Fictibacillus macauensis ZFHKF-1]